MVFSTPAPQNWSRAFTVWVGDLRVAFERQSVCRVITGGFLRQVRRSLRHHTLAVAGVFCLHCTHPGPLLSLAWGFEVPSILGVMELEGLSEQGSASWYGLGDGFDDNTTASGEAVDSQRLTCAHRSLPFGTVLRVENLHTGQWAYLRVNDRGPYTRGRVLDVSHKAAEMLGFQASGVAQVRLTVMNPMGRSTLPSPTPMGPWPWEGFGAETLGAAKALDLGIGSTPTKARGGWVEGVVPRMAPRRHMADHGSKPEDGSTHDVAPFIRRDP